MTEKTWDSVPLRVVLTCSYALSRKESSEYPKVTSAYQINSLSSLNS